MTLRVRLPPHAQVRSAKIRLRQGGLIAYATESCFGLGCDPRNPKALQRLIQFKKRAAHKGMIIVGSDMQQLQPFLAPLSHSEKTHATQLWPGPYTLILGTSHRTLPGLRGIGHHRLAVRISAHRDTVALCQILGMALVSTSANRAGKHPVKNKKTCQKLCGQHALTLSGNIGKRRRPSTIIDGTTGQILR